MPTKKPPAYLTEPPKGMWYEGPRKTALPWLARWRLTDGSKAGKSFATEHARASYAEDWVEHRAEFGKATRMVDEETMRAWHEADQIAGGVGPVALARFYAEHHGVAGGKLTLEDALPRFWEIRKHKEVSQDTKSHLVLHLDRLKEYHAKRRLNQFTAAVLRKWLHEELRNPDAGDGKFSASAINQHLRNVRIFFEAMVTERLLDHNPCDAVVPLAVPEKDKVILTPREAFDYFKANRDQDAAGPSAVECFGGLRFTSAARLTLEKIKNQSRGIEMPGVLHKSKKRKFRQGQPHNLWLWIKLAKESSWSMSEWEYNNAKRAAFVRALLKPAVITSPEEKDAVERLRNVFRNSFASYLLALTKNTPLVSYLMQHTNTKITEVYEGVADERDALLYFSITPAAVEMEWDKFVASATKIKAANLVPGL